jgi:hypothetical protein
MKASDLEQRERLAYVPLVSLIVGLLTVPSTRKQSGLRSIGHWDAPLGRRSGLA